MHVRWGEEGGLVRGTKMLATSEDGQSANPYQEIAYYPKRLLVFKRAFTTSGWPGRLSADGNEPSKTGN